MGVDLDTYRARIGRFRGGKNVYSTNIINITRLFDILPKLVSKLQAQGLSDHYVLIVLRLRGFPILYDDAFDKLTLELDVIVSESPDVLLLLKILKDPCLKKCTYHINEKPNGIQPAVPIFSGRDIFRLSRASAVI